ncbi:MAG: hypothetical protein F4213_09730 [Boseongicola sp. SB0677_bin_26]|nr:hypothetical protein [Boseongicola sp. SB0677_bin_26]
MQAEALRFLRQRKTGSKQGSGSSVADLHACVEHVPPRKASAVAVPARKERVDDALESGAGDTTRNDLGRQPGDACIEALAIESSQVEEDELSRGCHQEPDSRSWRHGKRGLKAAGDGVVALPGM